MALPLLRPKLCHCELSTALGAGGSTADLELRPESYHTEEGNEQVLWLLNADLPL